MIVGAIIGGLVGIVIALVGNYQKKKRANDVLDSDTKDLNDTL